MLSRGLRGVLNSINRPMPTTKAGRGAKEEAKLLSNEMIQENAIAYMENISETKMSDIIHYSDLLKEYEINLANLNTDSLRSARSIKFSLALRSTLYEIDCAM